MTSSLVGSEMCIRDRGNEVMKYLPLPDTCLSEQLLFMVAASLRLRPYSFCLLYTSDAADDM
eukprot:4975980-Prorocentrum_lima.AAC.1